MSTFQEVSPEHSTDCYRSPASNLHFNIYKDSNIVRVGNSSQCAQASRNLHKPENTELIIGIKKQ